MEVKPVTLTGKRVRLEPLGHQHADDLLVAAAHDEIWTYLDEPTPRTLPMINKLIDEALDEQARGERLPFAIIALDTGEAVGSISYIDIKPIHHGLEIGWGWLTPTRWRTGLTREAAQLLLQHAFEDLGAIRVALKTDVRNKQSQATIEALGATREGVWRGSIMLRDGYVRDSVYYSLVVGEWFDKSGRQHAEAARFLPLRPSLYSSSGAFGAGLGRSG